MNTDDNAHAQSNDKIDPRDAARKVLGENFFGVLSTHSKKFPGHPFGSVVPYCLDRKGVPLILISRLAQHTQNINEDNKVSLVVLERTTGNVQTDARLTLVGVAEKVSTDEVDDCAQRYYGHFPSAQGYHTELDFEFYRLGVEAMRYIPGFGQARWVSPSEVFKPNPFSPEAEARIVGHMNDDHGDALLHYYQVAPIAEKKDDVTAVTMAGIDSEGLALVVDEDLYRIEFSREVTDPMEARQMLVEMAQS
ncbi:MAG: DUF2470 domain-containing protein [Pseudomonadales bacterium]|nr:DUF2470 domain-containing protein [Pseudomonadales bacterium]